jgi:hypothetical protein
MTVAMKKIRNRPDRIAADVTFIEGIKTHLASRAQIPAGRREFTPAALAQFVQRRIDAANAIQTAKAAWLDAIHQYEMIDAETTVVVNDVRNLAKNFFGADGPELAAFGIAPPKTPTMSTETMLAAVAKRAATREARGTRGPKAKLKIKGVVPPAAPAIEASPGPSPEPSVEPRPPPIPDTPPTPLS